jgi:hypothetical protein
MEPVTATFTVFFGRFLEHNTNDGDNVEETKSLAHPFDYP